MLKECIRLKQNKPQDCEGDWCGSDGLCDCLFPESYECCKEMIDIKNDTEGGSNGVDTK